MYAKIYMNFTHIIRNITNELYKDNYVLFYLNMNFFYYLEDRLYRDIELYNYTII